MAGTDGPPVRVAIVNDYELVVVGVAALLAPYADRVSVVELDTGMPVVKDVDVILYDTFGAVQGGAIDFPGVVGESDAKLVIFSWNVAPELVTLSMETGASAYLSKGIDGPSLVAALEAIHAGRRIVPARDEVDVPNERVPGDWPGKESGLTAREAEIIALITQGLSNQEIADRSFLSINSIKTYIRTAYRKMGVKTRSQAVLWGVQHGFQPDMMRALVMERRDW